MLITWSDRHLPEGNQKLPRNIVYAAHVMVSIDIGPRRLSDDALKHPVKIGNTIKTSLIGYSGNAVWLSTRHETFTGVIDPDFVQKGDKGMAGVFFEISTKCLRRHVGSIGHIIQINLVVVVAHDEVNDVAESRTFMFRKVGGINFGTERLHRSLHAEQYLKHA